MSESFRDEIDRLKNEYEFDEKKLKQTLDEECAQAEENLKKEIELETNYRQNCLDIEIGKLRQSVEEKITEINKNRYKNIGVSEDVSNLPEYKDLIEKNRIKIEKEIDKERATFENESRARRARFDNHMKRLLEAHDTKKVDFLKKTIVPLVKSNGIHKLTDESILESRYHIKITRNAIRSGPSWALYKSRYQDKSVVCRVTVLANIPTEIRRDSNNAAKCLRFLAEKPAHESFVKLYDIFGTDQKLYTFMDELNPTNLGHIVYRGKATTSEIVKWSRQICDALIFMHNFAIAHLNIKMENIIFNDQMDVRVIGLGRAFCYFNLDQEKFIKVPQVKQAVYNDHLPPECFIEDFTPRPVDVWSFGLLIFEMITRTNPVRMEDSKAKRKKKRASVDVEKFQFIKITNAPQRALVESMLNPCWSLRPKLEEIVQSECFRKDTDKPSNSPPPNKEN